VRYINGVPKKLFVLVDVETGDVTSFIHTKIRKNYADESAKDQFKKATYVLVEKGGK